MNAPPKGQARQRAKRAVVAASEALKHAEVRTGAAKALREYADVLIARARRIRGSQQGV